MQPPLRFSLPPAERLPGATAVGAIKQNLPVTPTRPLDFRKTFRTAVSGTERGLKLGTQKAKQVAQDLGKASGRARNGLQTAGQRLIDAGAEQADRAAKRVIEDLEFDNLAGNSNLDPETALFESIRGARKWDPFKGDSQLRKELKNFNDLFIVERPEPAEEPEDETTEPTREEALRSQGYSDQQIELRDQLAANHLEGEYFDVYASRFTFHMNAYLATLPYWTDQQGLEAAYAQYEPIASQLATADLLARYGLDSNGHPIHPQVSQLDDAETTWFVACLACDDEDEFDFEFEDDDFEDYGLEDGGSEPDNFEYMNNSGRSGMFDSGAGRRTRDNNQRGAPNGKAGSSFDSGKRYGYHEGPDSGRSKSRRSKSYQERLLLKGAEARRDYLAGFQHDLKLATKNAVARIEQKAILSRFAAKRKPKPAAFHGQPSYQRLPNTRPPGSAEEPAARPEEPSDRHGGPAGQPSSPGDGGSTPNPEPADKDSGLAGAKGQRDSGKPGAKDSWYSIRMDDQYVLENRVLAPNPWNAKDAQGKIKLTTMVPDPEDANVAYFDRGDGGYVKFVKQEDGSWLAEYGTVYTDTPLGLVPGDWHAAAYALKKSGLINVIKDQFKRKKTDKDLPAWKKTLASLRKFTTIARAVLESESTGPNADKFSQEQVAAHRLRQLSVERAKLRLRFGRLEDHFPGHDRLMSGVNIAKAPNDTISAPGLRRERGPLVEFSPEDIATAWERLKTLEKLYKAGNALRKQAPAPANTAFLPAKHGSQQPDMSSGYADIVTGPSFDHYVKADALVRTIESVYQLERLYVEKDLDASAFRLQRNQLERELELLLKAWESSRVQ